MKTEDIISNRIIKPSPDGRYQDCWYWTRNTTKGGYGSVWFLKRFRSVHRVSAHLFLNFDFDSKLHVLHKCDNPPCFNPEHLFIGTNLDNIRDKINKGNCDSKLTKQIVSEIRNKFKAGSTRSQLKDEYNVSYSCIVDIISGDTWKY